MVLCLNNIFKFSKKNIFAVKIVKQFIPEERSSSQEVKWHLNMEHFVPISQSKTVQLRDQKFFENLDKRCCI